MTPAPRPAPEVIAVGCSAGGLKAMQILLAGLLHPQLPPVLLCCHTASREVSGLCGLLAQHTPRPVREAIERQPLQGGHIYVAPSGYHLLVEPDRHFALSVDPKVNYSRPSIDVLFESVARSYRHRALGVILTGANSDGAAGLKCIGDAGGLTMVQTPETAEVAIMPLAARDLARPDYLVALEAIAPLLNRLCQL